MLLLCVLDKATVSLRRHVEVFVLVFVRMVSDVVAAVAADICYALLAVTLRMG